ncbi:AMP-binding protein [Gemmata sp.]|uniref:AMP-binding protein n=1 Tax=Gemmata sp. TaxID=1914242 RepID=UPI003F6FBD35
MLLPLQLFVLIGTRVVLGLRYRARVTGLAEVLKKPGPYLILPSHPAYTDPPNVLRALWGTFRMRSLGLETNFNNPLLGLLAWVMRVIKVPELDRASAEARKKAEGAVAAVIDALKAGENVALWPSGTLSRNGADYLGAARTAADVLRVVPNATVVLVRTRGLWGSSFSWAYTGTKPRLVARLLRGVRVLLSNLLVFAPRRRVTMHLEAFGPGERPEPRREVLNPWIEAWFNADAPEVPTFVPYHFLFGPRTREFPPLAAGAELDLSAVKPSTKAAVAEALAHKLKRPLTDDENRAETTFAQLNIDSLEATEVTLEVEQRFGFTGDTVPTTVGQLWAIAAGLLDKGPPKPPPEVWFRPPSDTGPYRILGETVPEAFLNRALNNPDDVAVADDIGGALTFERLLVGSLAMAERFRALPGANVGLLLPASVGADVALFGLYLAGKLPVALNWTTGPANLAHAARLTGLTHVVTSKAFIDRTHIEVAGTQFVYLEEVRRGVGKLELLRRLLAVRWFPNAVRRKALGRVPNDPHAPAVVLFTSGSEKAPKAVPLTHANIIADHRGAEPPQQLVRTDAVLGFLPMFHSFGLTIATLLPVLAGSKLVHHPDPTDATGLARKLAAYKPTILIATPTFLGFILGRCKPGDLDSLRLVVVGAERCPDELFDRVAALAPRATVLEGYGVTECGPCVSVNPVVAVRRGTVGKPLPGVDVCVVDLESDRVLPANERGMLLVSGPTVFPGYLGTGAESPFRELSGKRWYVTGDLASLDPDGYLVFHGRLKRFLKAGGEMISLPALEEPFTQAYPPTDAGPRVAVEGVELPGGGRRVVLFTTEDIGLRDANAVLVQEGFRGVMRLDDVRRVPSIPVLGTGKTDYKVLRGMLAG